MKNQDTYDIFPQISVKEEIPKTDSFLFTK